MRTLPWKIATFARKIIRREINLLTCSSRVGLALLLCNSAVRTMKECYISERSIQYENELKLPRQPPGAGTTLAE